MANSVVDMDSGLAEDEVSGLGESSGVAVSEKARVYKSFSDYHCFTILLICFVKVLVKA